MDIAVLARLAACFTVAAFFVLSYKYEFKLKGFYRSLKMCRKSGHKNVTVYGRTQQCRICYKVSDISWEVTKR